MQVLLNALIQGLILGLLSLGFSIVYNSTGIMNIAQGAVYALIPYMFLFFINNSYSITYSIVCSIIVSMFISGLFELINHWFLYKKNASSQIHLISSLGIYIALVQFITIIWGSESQVLTEEISEPYKIYNLIFTQPQLLSFFISSLIIVIFFIWSSKSYLGLKLRALQDNPIQLSLMGHNIKNLRLLVFILSGFFTSISSLLNAYDIGFDPQVGLNVILFSIVATVIGGKGSLLGAVIGSILLSIIRSQVSWYIDSKWENSITFLILVFFLFFRPYGIISKKGRLETI